MPSTKKKNKVVAKLPVAKSPEAVQALKNIVNNNGFAGRDRIAKRVFSVVCDCPINQNVELPKDVLKANIKRKMQFVNEITENEESRPVRDNIRELAEILISPPKQIKKTKAEKIEPVLEVKANADKVLRKMVLDLLLAQTARSRVGLVTKEKQISNLSPKASEVQNFMDENRSPFGCQTKVVAKSISAYLGEEIVIEGEDEENSFKNFFPFGVVVDGEEDSILITDINLGGNGIRGFNTSGDIAEIEETNCRPATDVEIKSFLTAFNASDLRKVFNFLEVL